MKNCTRKNRQTSKKCPRRSYRKTRRNGGWTPTNPHHTKDMKTKQKEEQKENNSQNNNKLK